MSILNNDSYLISSPHYYILCFLFTENVYIVMIDIALPGNLTRTHGVMFSSRDTIFPIWTVNTIN